MKLTDYNRAVENHLARTAILNTTVNLPAKILKVSYNTFVAQLSNDKFISALMPFITIHND